MRSDNGAGKDTGWAALRFRSGGMHVGDKLKLKLDDKGLIAAIVQDDANGDVLMVAWMNEEAVRKTLETRRATFYSRSRKKLWVKGEESGNFQTVTSVRVDCDQDVLLLRVKQAGGACHEGYRSCFFREVDGKGNLRVLGERLFDPGKVYKKSE
jgi:phosphoribosyl-AMP cyclohydrolase